MVRLDLAGDRFLVPDLHDRGPFVIVVNVFENALDRLLAFLEYADNSLALV